MGQPSGTSGAQRASRAEAARTFSRPAPVRRDLLALTPPVHGGAVEAGRAGLLDFSASLNFFLPPVPFERWWHAVSLDRYPDPDCRQLRRQLAASAAVPEESIWVGNGASELISALSLACLEPGHRVLVLGPTFGEYERAARVARGAVAVRAAAESEGLQWTAAAIRQAVASVRPRLVWLCNPNNPTGQYLRRRQIEAVIAGSEALWALDESYLPFVEEPDDWRDLALSGRVVLVRSLTKLFRVPGLRLGYLVGAPEVVHTVRMAQPAWSVGAAAQQFGLALLQHPWPWQDVLAALRTAREQLACELWALGLEVLPSAANFLLARVGSAATVAAALERRGIVVRDATSFGLPAWIRVAVRQPADNRRLVEALRAEVG